MPNHVHSPTSGSTEPGERPDPALIQFVERSKLLADGARLQFERLTGGVSSDIWCVRGGTRTFCVKRALPRLRVAADWQAPVERNSFESAWFRVVAAFMPESVPEVLYEEPQNGMFAMTYLPPDQYRNWKALLLQGQIDPVAAIEVGRRLSRIHARTANSAELANRFATDAIFHAIRIEPYLLATARAHPDLSSRLVQLAERTQETKLTLVHGDISPKNILIGPAAPVFIDAECAWYGDPAFDLCFCLKHLLLKCLIRRSDTRDLLEAFRLLAATYLAGVDWEDPRAFEARAAALLPGLTLARVDGKSPVEYITTDQDRDCVRRAARGLLVNPPDRIAAVADAWGRELRQINRG